MDGLKELVEAFSARIKSPIIGSIALAFVAVNWRPVFFLFFSGEPANDKFEYFTTNTTGLSLYLLPVIVGLIFALVVPWVNFFGAKAIESPVSKHRNMQLDAAHALTEKKTRHAIDMETLDVDYRRALLKGAKVEQEIKEANIDDDVRMDLDEKISMALKNQRTTESYVVDVPDKIPTGALNLLNFLSQDKTGEFRFSDDGKEMKIVCPNGQLINSKGRENYFQLAKNLKDLVDSRLISIEGSGGVIKESGYEYLSFYKGKNGEI